jgi:hypothetical protein
VLDAAVVVLQCLIALFLALGGVLCLLSAGKN